MGEIGEIISGGTPSTSNDNYWNGNISWITPADLSNYKEKYISRGKRNISIEGLENSSAKIICKGSVLFSSRAPIGYVVISEKEVTTNQGFKSISPYIENSEHYIYYFLLAEKENISLKASGTTFKELSGTEFGKIFIPLPPLAEQKRIIEKIEELLALVDDLETNKTDLQSYIKQAKSKVLEMAVRGELVPQNPEDEPASVLLERIKKEQKSSKSKGKNTAHNTHYEEELLFDIPKNWAWCRLGELCDIYQPKTITTKEITKSGKYKVFGANGVIGYYDKYNHDFEEVAVTCRGATCGTVNMTEAKSWITGNAMVIKPLNSYLSKKYLFYYLKNSNMEDIITGSAQPQITKTKIEKLLFITPPLAEQKRIVEKIEEIFSVLEFIEENLI